MNRRIKLVVSTSGLCLVLLCLIWRLVGFVAAEETWKGMVLVLTYRDGTTQSVNLKQPSQNIVKIEFVGDSTKEKPAASEINYVKGFEGKWNTNWGILEYEVDGIQTRGKYTHDQGKIEARLSSDGKTMEGMWMEAPSYKPPRDGGRVIFKLSEDGNTISGYWWYGQNEGGGNWTGTRIK